MSKLVNQGDCIECQEAIIISRKFIRGPLIDDETVGSIVQMDLQKNSSFECTKENDPKETRRCHKSKLDSGLQLEAHGIFIEISGNKYPKPEPISHHSSTHGAQKIKAKKYAYGEITLPHRFVLERQSTPSLPAP